MRFTNFTALKVIEDNINYVIPIMRLFILLIIFLFGQVAVAQDSVRIADKTKLILVDDDPVLAAIDSMMATGYFESLGFNDNVGALNAHNYHKDSIPTFDSLTYTKRFEKLNANSPFSLVYNNYIKGYINLYAKRRKKITAAKARRESCLFRPSLLKIRTTPTCPTVPSITGVLPPTRGLWPTSLKKRPSDLSIYTRRPSGCLKSRTSV